MNLLSLFFLASCTAPPDAPPEGGLAHSDGKSDTATTAVEALQALHAATLLAGENLVEMEAIALRGATETLSDGDRVDLIAELAARGEDAESLALDAPACAPEALGLGVPSVAEPAESLATFVLLQAAVATVEAQLEALAAELAAAGEEVDEDDTLDTEPVLRARLDNIEEGEDVVEEAAETDADARVILDRMYALLWDMASETMPDDQRMRLVRRYARLASSLDRLALRAEANGIALADGSRAEVGVVLGASASERIAIPLEDLRGATLWVDTASIDPSTASGAVSGLWPIEVAQALIDTHLGELEILALTLESEE